MVWDEDHGYGQDWEPVVITKPSPSARPAPRVQPPAPPSAREPRYDAILILDVQAYLARRGINLAALAAELGEPEDELRDVMDVKVPIPYDLRVKLRKAMRQN